MGISYKSLITEHFYSVSPGEKPLTFPSICEWTLDDVCCKLATVTTFATFVQLRPSKSVYENKTLKIVPLRLCGL